MNLEFKTFEFKADKVDESTGLVQGYASIFNNLDYGFDIVEPGAFKKTIKENRGVFPILFNHRPDEQIGWNREANEDTKGLAVVGELDLNVQRAKERFSLAKKAIDLDAPSGLSIGYLTVKSEPDTDNRNIRRLKELKLFEYSLVTFPMNAKAFITAAKSLNAIDKAKFLLKHLEDEGISLSDFEIALHEEAAKKSYDPLKFEQSLDYMIGKFLDK